MASAATQSTYRSFPSSLFLLRWDSFHNFTRLPFSLPSLPRSPLPLQNMQIPPERGRVIWSRPFVGRLPPGGHSIAFWRSKLEFILVLRRFRAPSFPPPSSPFGRFLVSPFASVVRWSRRPRPRPRLPFLRPMQPTMQQVWVGSPASPPCPPSPSPRDMQSGWIYPLKSERP